MIERDIIRRKLKEFQVEEYVKGSLRGVGHSSTKIKRTPLGEKIIITASRPGLVVGRKGQNIKKLTKTLKKGFELENPEIEISEIEKIHLDANVVSEMIANSLEKFGTQKFKGVGHKTMNDVMNAGALGIEILISGKIPGARAKRWRFSQGYLKKSGDTAVSEDGVKKAYTYARLKKGVVGVQVRLMLPDTKLPDSIKITEQVEVVEKKVVPKVKKKKKNEGKRTKGSIKKRPKKKA